MKKDIIRIVALIIFGFLAICISSIVWIPLLTILTDDIEIVLMKTFSTSDNIPLTLQYDAKDLSLEDLKSKIDSLRRVNPEYAVFVDSLDSVTSCDSKGNNGLYDYYSIYLFIPEVNVYFICFSCPYKLQVNGYYDRPPKYIGEDFGCACDNAYHKFGVEQRRNRDKRQKEVIEAIDKVMRKIDKSLKPHETYVY